MDAMESMDSMDPYKPGHKTLSTRGFGGASPFQLETRPRFSAACLATLLRAALIVLKAGCALEATFGLMALTSPPQTVFPFNFVYVRLQVGKCDSITLCLIIW